MMELEDLILRYSLPSSLRAGRALYYQGDDGQAAYRLESGKARLLRPRADGSGLVVGEALPGSWLGLAEAWLGLPYALDIVATEACALRKSSRANLRELAKDGRFGALVADELARALYSLYDRLEAGGAAERVAGVLLALLGREPASPETRHVRVTQGEIAEAAGLSRETVNKSLSRLEKAGILETGRGEILVYDREALRSFSE